jgi:hypothetical protein
MSELAEDPRLALIYQEAQRGLVQQRDAVESLHNRAGILIFAASFAGSLLGGRALSDGLGVWDWAGAALLAGIGVLTVVLLWPYYNLSFRLDPEELLERYVDQDSPASVPTMQRELALAMKADWRRNGRVVRRLREVFQVALVFLILDILAWLISIAGQGS